MLRRSIRLHKAGYYMRDGTPSISYKEKLYKVFKRRMSHVPTAIDGVGAKAADSQQSSRSRNNRQGRKAPETLTPTLGSVRNQFLIIFGALMIIVMSFLLAVVNKQSEDLDQLQQKVESLLQRMDAPLVDRMPNLALRSLGSQVFPELSSPTYWPVEDCGKWSGAFCSWFKPQSHHRVIQGHSSLYPGNCWCFPGDQGFLVMSLFGPASITNVTLGHITKSQSPTGEISSAPREFSVYGLRTATETGTYLGTLVYNQDGAAFQTFELLNPDKHVFRYVKVLIENNWGNKDSTCFYSFKVHGQLAT